MAFRHRQDYVRLRDDFLARNPLCALCLKRGRTVEAEEVDHVLAIYLGGSLMDAGNLQALCRLCHQGKTSFELSEYPPGSELAERLKRSIEAKGGVPD